MDLKNYQRYKKSFTIIELLFVILIVSFLVPTIFSIYTWIQKQKTEIDIKQKIMFQWYELFEKINILIKDYTIDYEEYFNRSMVWCTNWAKYGNDFKWDVNNSWYCSNFTAYGNENSFLSTSEKNWALYYLANHNNYFGKTLENLVGDANTVKYKKTLADINQGKQSFWQYAKLFFDVKNDTDLDWKLEGDSDDEDLWIGPQAIQDPQHIQELYLISLDGKERLFFRRKLIKQEHLVENSNKPYLPEESLYTLQILRLKWFDAWSKHDFREVNSGNPWIYDGVIDTWACDASQGFIWKGQSIWGVYTSYRLPEDEEDCWIDLYQSSISLSAWNLVISPRSDPNLAWNQTQFQIHPYISLFTYNGLYRPAWKDVSDEKIMNFFFPLKTTLNIKTSYLE